MTDKQIIIDETKCPWFNNGSCDLFNSDKEECWYRQCKDTTNCYYRETQTQLKRKEQECEELKENLPNAITRLMGELDQLKAENDELKEEIAKARMEICNQCSEKTDYNIPCKQIRDLDYGLQMEIEENEKLKQTLTEIKEIAEKYNNPHLTHFGEQQYCCKDILQKISEVENGRN